jgi:hypothetical protein
MIVAVSDAAHDGSWGLYINGDYYVGYMACEKKADS